MRTEPIGLGRVYRAVTDEDLQEARRRTREGMQAAKRGDLPQAVRLYDQALLAGDDLLALMNRACAHYHLRDWRRAVRDSSWALEVDPERPHMWLVRGLARARLTDLVGAKQDLERYLQLNPRSHRTLGERALRNLERALAA